MTFVIVDVLQFASKDGGRAQIAASPHIFYRFQSGEEGRVEISLPFGRSAIEMKALEGKRVRITLETLED